MSQLDIYIFILKLAFLIQYGMIQTWLRSQFLTESRNSPCLFISNCFNCLRIAGTLFYCSASFWKHVFGFECNLFPDTLFTSRRQYIGAIWKNVGIFGETAAYMCLKQRRICALQLLHQCAVSSDNRRQVVCIIA